MFYVLKYMQENHLFICFQGRKSFDWTFVFSSQTDQITVALAKCFMR